MRTHFSEHESESNSLIRKVLRKEECSKAGVERHGVEPIVNVRCHNFHNMLGRLFFFFLAGAGGGVNLVAIYLLFIVVLFLLEKILFT